MSPLDRLTHELSKLPGIGGKTALRLVLHILRQPSQFARNLSEALLDVVEKVKFCNLCFHLTDQNPCRICGDVRRDSHTVCVVEESADLLAIERTRDYRGVYHVLQGVLSPLDGIGPEQLRIKELVERLQSQTTKEVILAMNHDVTGDATALYLTKILKPLGVRLTKLAGGIPVGGDLQYLDQMTLSRAIESRVEC